MQMGGRVAIVTGASRGLGRAIAKAYAGEGAKVVVTSRPRSPTGLPGTAAETAQEIQAAGGDALAVACDVSDGDQVEDMVRQAMDRYGQIDVLVNNAGIMIPSEPFLDIDPARWDELWAVNVRGPYLACRHVVPIMMRQRSGSIVNIGSRAADAPSNGGTAYNSSKIAVHMFSRCLAEELREYDIAVNVLSPGSLRSEGSSVIPWARHDWHERVEPDECGPSAVFLALQSAETFTGQVKLRAEFGKTWP
ncbi:MAG: SDR family oxidoreductase [Alphaproteobacteria bacterium]|jgi:3-oxoacyl-[acyl-carrier protein] reductase|nr:SDR family oxidoreductase [Alphaproteobacteria bacterium]